MRPAPGRVFDSPFLRVIIQSRCCHGQDEDRGVRGGLSRMLRDLRHHHLRATVPDGTGPGTDDLWRRGAVRTRPIRGWPPSPEAFVPQSLVGYTWRHPDARSRAGCGHPGALVIAPWTVLLQLWRRARRDGWGDAAGPDPRARARGGGRPARLPRARPDVARFRGRVRLGGNGYRA